MAFISILSIIIVAFFVGSYGVWSVTSKRHAPRVVTANAFYAVVIFGLQLLPATAHAESIVATEFASRWTMEPVAKLASGTILKPGMSLLKFRILPDSLFVLEQGVVSKDGKWKLPALTELDGQVSSFPLACSQTARRKAKYRVFYGQYFESKNFCLLDSDRDGKFDKSFEVSGFSLRIREFRQAIVDSRKNDSRLYVNETTASNLSEIDPIPYAKKPSSDSKNILYMNIFHAGNHALVGEFSLGFCLDYLALEKPCSSLRVMTLTRSFKKSEVPAKVRMIGSDFTIQRVDGSNVEIELIRVPERHTVTITLNPFNIE